MLVTELGIVIDVRLEQFLNVSLSIDVKLLDSVTEFRLEQPSNILHPILVTEFGIVIEARPVQPVKA